MKKRYLTAQEATELLDISAATLYAYVSRGLIRSEAAEGSNRSRRYHAEDVTRLLERKAERQNPARIAEAALNWGMPVLDSALTLIADDGLYYRGYDAILLAQTRSLEEVAALLWTGRFETSAALFSGPQVQPSPWGVAALDGRLSLYQRMMTALALASEDDLLAYDLSADNVARTGARILDHLTAALVGADVAGDRVAGRLQAGWCAARPDAAGLLNAALVLCADHELNASSFAARVAASAETQPYGVIMTGLATAQGLKHGGNTERVAALLRELDEPGAARRVIAERLRRGERIPGFGHPLYQNGDPRAAFLLDRLRADYADTPVVRLADAATSAVRATLALEPNIDFVLVVLARLFELPAGAPLALFALGRTVGWVAHAIEQYQTQQLIRPRARYVGPTPGDTESL